MQYNLSDRAVLSVESADYGDLVEIQILTTTPVTGKIVGRTPVAKVKPAALIALGQALSYFAIACTGSKEFYHKHNEDNCERDED